MSETIRIDIKITDRKVRRVGFLWNATQTPGTSVPVAISTSGNGSFEAVPNEKGLLSWVMEGDAGSSMTVGLYRDGAVLVTPRASKIPGGATASRDRFLVKVP